MDSELKAGLDIIMNNQREQQQNFGKLEKQIYINNLLLLANNPNLSVEMQQEYLSRALTLMGEPLNRESSSSLSFK